MTSASVSPLSALVTGAASGVGRHIATTLAARGTPVAALDRDWDGLATLQRTSSLITPFVCDVSDEHAVQQTVEAAQDAVSPFDRVLHCAGIAPLGRLLEQPAPDIERVMRVNYLGTVHVAQATVPLMVQRGGGSLTVIASIASWIPLSDIGAYSASKAAVAAFCEVLAAECRPAGVRVVCVCPPGIETPMLEELRRTHPDVVNNRPGIQPADVFAAGEKALHRGKLFTFPGRGTTALWWARRLAPTGLSRLLNAAVKRQVGRQRTASDNAAHG
jgi:NAD(P)-dependent dehydrogenase (short-subunit alcohol dehydrogenase family)